MKRSWIVESWNDLWLSTDGVFVARLDTELRSDEEKTREGKAHPSFSCMERPGEAKSDASEGLGVILGSMVGVAQVF